MAPLQPVDLLPRRLLAYEATSFHAWEPVRIEIDLLRWREDLWIRSGDSIRQIRQHGDVYRQMVRVERPADDTGHPWNTRCVAQCCR